MVVDSIVVVCCVVVVVAEVVADSGNTNGECCNLESKSYFDMQSR